MFRFRLLRLHWVTPQLHFTERLWRGAARDGQCTRQDMSPTRQRGGRTSPSLARQAQQVDADDSGLVLAAGTLSGLFLSVAVSEAVAGGHRQRLRFGETRLAVESAAGTKEELELRHEVAAPQTIVARPAENGDIRVEIVTHTLADGAVLSRSVWRSGRLNRIAGDKWNFGPDSLLQNRSGGRYRSGRQADIVRAGPCPP
jgi:hypothetical protein